MAKFMFITFFLLYTIAILLFSVEGSSRNDHPTEMRHKKPAKRLFVFGDSYADTGNTAKGLANSWKFPYGITFPGKPSGRFSDGRILTDYIAKFLGFTAPMPYTMRKFGSHKARHGVNFAYGGTGALNTVATMKLGFPNMTTQIDFFQQMLQGNDAVTLNPDLSDAVAYVSLVGNDYNTYLGTGGSFKELPNFIEKVVAQLVVDLDRIRSLGVKTTYVTGLQPLGCLPQTTVSSSFKECDKTDNQAVQLHNSLLQQAVGNLNAKSNAQGPKIYILDLFSAFNTVFQEQHGPSGSLRFKDPLKPCCFPTDPNGSCSDEDDKGNKLYTLCDNPSAMFFWDTYHPTEAGWRAVFAHLKDTLQHAF